jgi:hypothetical protein
MAGELTGPPFVGFQMRQRVYTASAGRGGGSVCAGLRSRPSLHARREFDRHEFAVGAGQQGELDPEAGGKNGDEYLGYLELSRELG